MLCFAFPQFIHAARPPFDKAPYRKTAWLHANPWWSPRKHRVDAAGGPDVGARRYPQGGIPMWAAVAKQLQAYGITGIQLESSVSAPYYNTYREMLAGFAEAGNGMKVSFFLTMGSKKPIEDTMTFFTTLEKELDHPNLYKLNGSPVISIYAGGRLSPEMYQNLLSTVEARFGRMIWLIDANHATPEFLRKYMPVLDGITMYGNWGIETQQKMFDEITPVMQKEFPEKIFEGAAQNQYCNHFHYGGVSPRLLDKYLASWQTIISAGVDSVTMTNLFDHYEHSHHLPSYSWEDILLRIAQYHLAGWRGEKPYHSRIPEYYVVNSANVVIGQNAPFDVFFFPTNDRRQLNLQFSVTDAKGNLLHDFGKITPQPDKFSVHRFNLPTLELADQRALYPKINNQVYPQATNLVTGIRPWMLYWVRSNLNRIGIRPYDKPEIDPCSWLFNGQPGGTDILYPEDGWACISAFARPVSGPERYHSGGHVRILRNSREIASFNNWDLNFTRIFPMPDPVDALDYYQLELENSFGSRFTTAPVWVLPRRRTGKISLPVFSDGQVVQVQIDANRVPYFHYRCQNATGLLLQDSSGYEHHGYIGGEGYGGGHLQQTGYRHEHTGPVPPRQPEDPLFQRDPDGRGYYQFKGKGYMMLMGGTMPPYASTVELDIRLKQLVPGGILGTGNRQLSMQILPDGRLQLHKENGVEGMGGDKPAHKHFAEVISKDPLPLNQWVKVSVVYDLQKVTLFINKQIQGEATFPPCPEHEWFNAMVIGALGTFPYSRPENFAQIDIRDIRVYGRNLSPEEFLP